MTNSVLPMARLRKPTLEAIVDRKFGILPAGPRYCIGPIYVAFRRRSDPQSLVALPSRAKAAVMAAMGTKSREVIWGSTIMGADIHARHAREEAQKAAREADRAQAYAWSVRMEGYGGPAQPSPTIGQCIHGGLGWLEVECNRCKTRASMPLDAIRRPRDTPIWKLEASLKCRSCRKGRYAPRPSTVRLPRWGGRVDPHRGDAGGSKVVFGQKFVARRFCHARWISEADLQVHARALPWSSQ
jgi:hypothetical protein